MGIGADTQHGPDGPERNVIMPTRCDYCGEETGNDSEVCGVCAGKIERGEYGICAACGHPLDARGMCTAPMSAAD